jgi:hypothetical protein
VIDGAVLAERRRKRERDFMAAPAALDGAWRVPGPDRQAGIALRTLRNNLHREIA